MHVFCLFSFSLMTRLNIYNKHASDLRRASGGNPWSPPPMEITITIYHMICSCTGHFKFKRQPNFTSPTLSLTVVYYKPLADRMLIHGTSVPLKELWTLTRVPWALSSSWWPLSHRQIQQSCLVGGMAKSKLASHVEKLKCDVTIHYLYVITAFAVASQTSAST